MSLEKQEEIQRRVVVRIVKGKRVLEKSFRKEEWLVVVMCDEKGKVYLKLVI